MLVLVVDDGSDESTCTASSVVIVVVIVVVDVADDDDNDDDNDDNGDIGEMTRASTGIMNVMIIVMKMITKHKDSELLMIMMPVHKAISGFKSSRPHSGRVSVACSNSRQKVLCRPLDGFSNHCATKAY
ncbi:hypothetical protein PoB_006762200 [Plakobranchus ocellatus]|uniref:Uncharacterized protein n=1 Tax=Plakobranchus ocellatus TaxID=259542 RepID=A0AAV4DA37_9GAST|nr:hypothetical protein PoB_006762200 [Plakobranchus ocellatus]